jgi:hypothetical protein
LILYKQKNNFSSKIATVEQIRLYFCNMKRSLVFLAGFLIFGAQQLFAQGCSQCRMLAEQSTELDEASFGSNINFGILYLMVIPYLLLLFLFRKKIMSFLQSMLKKQAR